MIEGLDNAVNAFVSRTLIFQDDAWTKNRCRAFVLQHRRNTRHRNSVLKLKVATNCPIWNIKLDIVDSCCQEIDADQWRQTPLANPRGPECPNRYGSRRDPECETIKCYSVDLGCMVRFDDKFSLAAWIDWEHLF